MIKYHGTPIGGSNRDAMLFLQGRHALVSFEAPGHLPEVMSCCESFCLDNGAFSVWRRGEGKVNEKEYLRWIQSIRDHPAFDFFIIPDVIDGTENENDEAIKRWKKIKGGVPVYHLGESVARFNRLASEFPLVCLGSTSKWPSVGSDAWWPYIADLMDTICKNGVPPCKLHGLRMLNPNVFTRLPLHSADSCNAAVNNHICLKKGVYPNLERWQGSERIARRIEAYQSAAVWSRTNLEKENADIFCT